MPIVVDTNPAYDSEESRRAREHSDRQQQRQMLMQMLGLGVNTAMNIRQQNQQADQFKSSQNQQQSQFDANQARLDQTRKDMLAARDREWDRETRERKTLSTIAGRPDPGQVGPPQNLDDLPTEELRFLARAKFAQQAEDQKNQYAAKRAADLIERRIQDGTLTPEQAQSYVKRLEVLPESAGSTVDEIEGLAALRIGAQAKLIRGQKSQLALDPVIEQFELSGMPDEDLAFMRYIQSEIGQGNIEPKDFLKEYFDLKQKQQQRATPQFTPQEVSAASEGDIPAAVGMANKGFQPALTHVFAAKRSGMDAAASRAEKQVETWTDRVFKLEQELSEKKSAKKDAKDIENTQARLTNARAKLQAAEKRRDETGKATAKPERPAEQPKNQTGMTAENAIDAAWSELGPEADPAKVKARAEELMRGPARPNRP